VTLDPRIQHVPDPDYPGHFNILRGTVWPLGDHGVTGIKVVGDYHANYEHDLPSELALVTLYDPRTGVPLAIVDGTGITDRRTGALTALGARELARKDARVLGHLGARGSAYSTVTMLDHVFDFDEIRVTSRRPASRQAFGRRLEQALGKPVRAVDTIEEAVRGADIVVEATRLTAPEVLLPTDWLEPGMLLVTYGVHSILDLDVIAAADKVLVDDWQQTKPGGRFGALRAHVEAGLLNEDNLYAEFHEVLTGRKPGRERADELIVFWHRGLSITDVALGHLLVERARERGLGTTLRYR
jgi:ornithine cyclodeaminase